MGLVSLHTVVADARLVLTLLTVIVNIIQGTDRRFHINIGETLFRIRLHESSANSWAITDVRSTELTEIKSSSSSTTHSAGWCA